jgi:hypothetical protein
MQRVTPRADWAAVKLHQPRGGTPRSSQRLSGLATAHEIEDRNRLAETAPRTDGHDLVSLGDVDTRDCHRHPEQRRLERDAKRCPKGGSLALRATPDEDEHYSYAVALR